MRKRLNPEVQKSLTKTPSRVWGECRDRVLKKVKEAQEMAQEWVRHASLEQHVYQGAERKLKRVSSCCNNFRYQEWNKKYCDKPIFCERCMEFRKAYILSDLLRALNVCPEMHCTVYTHRYSFPRAVYYDGEECRALFKTYVEGSRMLSDKGFNVDEAYGDNMYDLLYTLQGHLKDFIQERNRDIHRYGHYKEYLGQVVMVHSYPYSKRLCCMEMKEIIFWKKVPPALKHFVSKEKIRGKFFNYEVEHKTRGYPRIVTKENAKKLLDVHLRSDTAALLNFIPEELIFHLGALGSSKTLLSEGLIFSGSSVKSLHPEKSTVSTPIKELKQSSHITPVEDFNFVQNQIDTTEVESLVSDRSTVH